MVYLNLRTVVHILLLVRGYNIPICFINFGRFFLL